MTKRPITSLLTEIKTLAKSGARFVSVLYTAKESGEIARHTVNVGVSIEKAYRRDLAVLKGKRATLEGIDLVACDELIASLSESLTVGIGNNSAYTCAGVYEPLARGMKLHTEKGALHLFGFTVGKDVIVPGTYKKVNSSAKTIAKNALRRTLKSGKFRQFAVSELESVAMNGRTLALS